jgi:hypothetical protein
MNAAALPLRRLVYPLLIVVAAAAVGGRILAVTRVYEPYLFRDPGSTDETRGLWPAVRPKPMATLSVNDRSRWATVRALVDEGTYVIGERTVHADGSYEDRGIMMEDGWQTIDKVMNPDTHEFFSSKPPLLPTLLAGEYWLLKNTLGWSITDPGGQVVRVILVTTNWLPFVIYLLLLAWLVEGLGRTDWGRLYVVACGAFATFLTPFAITLNNHSIAACSALFALYPFVRLWSAPPQSNAAAWYALPAGFFAGFTACNELPAAALAGAMFLALLMRRPRSALLLFLPAAAIPVAAFLATNYLAIGQLRPAYSEVGGPWYEYKDSYWQLLKSKDQPGIDGAGTRETKAEYAFHLLLGHHGLFSLTPIFLLSIIGILLTLGRRRPESGDPADPSAGIALLCLALTGVVVTFYVFQTSNYGGWACGPRWLMWLTPFLLAAMIPCADALSGRRWGRGLAYLLLAISVISVSYPAWNPWRHPWLYDLLEWRGLLPY